MKDYLKKNGIRMGIIVAAVVLIISLSSAARGGQISLFHNVSGVLLSPVQKVVSSAVNWFDTIYGYLYEYDSLMAENESLRTQLAEAQQSARDGIEASEENQRLRELLNLREKHTDYEFEPCKVVLWSSSNWSHSFTISKGASSGIELGDPVVTEYNAVVGQITELGETWATVSTSPFFMVPFLMWVMVSGAMWTSPAATATRCVTAFSVTSTILARPCSLKCVSSDMVQPPI